jgi:hypothetical protein
MDRRLLCVRNARQHRNKRKREGRCEASSFHADPIVAYRDRPATLRGKDKQILTTEDSEEKRRKYPNTKARRPSCPDANPACTASRGNRWHKALEANSSCLGWCDLRAFVVCLPLFLL